jgi:D-alanyl-D-alanine dipeptidase
MNHLKLLFSLFTSLLLFSCTTIKSTATSNLVTDEVIVDSPEELSKELLSNRVTVHDTVFVNIMDYSSDFILDMKYATTDNFLKTQVYDCATCLLRFKTVKNLILANEEFKTKGYRIKIFDCYRPLEVQKKMWKIVSDPEYVADPKKGSIHNRGGAVDISLVDFDGNTVDMGTGFDFFGPEASHFYQKLPNSTLKNRLLLKQIMLKHNFSSFDSEWWHYNLRNSSKWPLANFKWDCK